MTVKCIFNEISEWKGVPYVSELYDQVDFANLTPVTQIQAVAFQEHTSSVVFYRHIDGFFGLPGGTVEAGEKFEETLAREIGEEIMAEMIECGPIAYIKSWKQHHPEAPHYHLRYWANVRLIARSLNDPAGKAVDRVVVPIEQAIEKLGWGEKGKLLIALALKNRKTSRI